MLEKSPDVDIQKEADEDLDDAVHCRACNHLITRTRWAIDMGGHERVFINPAGRVFRIACYREAPGCGDEGMPTEEHTWFPGYAWNLAICLGCGGHMGWRFIGDVALPVFFGLIKTGLKQ